MSTPYALLWSIVDFNFLPYLIPKMMSVSRLPFCTSSKVNRPMVKVTRPLNAMTENQPYLRNRKAYKVPLSGGEGIS